MDYSKLWLKDYRHDTRGLDPMLHGIYLLMIFEFLGTEKPLPVDLDALCFITEARTAKERAGVQKILKRFWLRLEDGWVQKLAFIVILDYWNGLEVKKNNGAGKGGARKPWTEFTIAKKALGDVLANCQRTGSDSLSDCYRITSASLAELVNQESVTSNQKPRTMPAPGGSLSDPEFNWVEQITTAYVRADDPVGCRGLVLAAIRSGQDPAKMLAAVQACASGIKTLSTWKTNSMVPAARNFFGRQEWKSPEAFAQRYVDMEKKNKGAGRIDTKPSVAVRVRIHRDLPEPPCEWRAVLVALHPKDEFPDANLELPWGLYEPDTRRDVMSECKRLKLLPEDWRQPPVPDASGKKEDGGLAA